MLNAIAPPAEMHLTSGRSTDVMDDVRAVCLRIPPLWDLNNYVAVNPFLAYAGQPIDAAAGEITEALGAAVLPSIVYYRDRWNLNEFGPADLDNPNDGPGHGRERIIRVLSGQAAPPLRAYAPVVTFAEQHDRQHGGEWSETMIRSASRWCAAHASSGGSHWSMGQSSGLFRSWREAASVDRSLDLYGVRGFRAWVARIPDTPEAAIEYALARIDLLDEHRQRYLYKLLGGVFGWASYFRRATWRRGSDDPGEVGELLAIRASMDAAAADLSPGTLKPSKGILPVAVEDEAFRLACQDGLENAHARRLLGGLNRPLSADIKRPTVQAVFCIDVRSEPLRRSLEAQSDAIETIGFAGFFGVALDWQCGAVTSPRCPVLLQPAVSICSTGSETSAAVGRPLQRTQSAPAAAFTYVEVLGLAYGLKLVRDAATTSGAASSPEPTAPFSLEANDAGCGIGQSDRVKIAASILKNMSFGERFARIILLCGHHGQSANNPQAAGLDCGACGGHGGAINARVAAALLNDPAVRNGLTAQGWSLPDDTHFLPAVHNTTTDSVRLLDVDRAPSSHQSDVANLRLQLDAASKQTQLLRAAGLGLSTKSPDRIDQVMRRKACDWSEVRPEWGLAGNAAFLAARRCRTRGVDLGGRTFLHEYDASRDPTGDVLSLILSAPMVVASWINLQYFASTVDNRFFGAGDKTIHNRVGSIGVVLGNGGDLRTGLAEQSVFNPDGTWFHQPLRLQVIVEAERSAIDRVLAAQSAVMDLIQHGWVRLFALSPHGQQTDRWTPQQGWKPFHGEDD